MRISAPRHSWTTTNAALVANFFSAFGIGTIGLSLLLHVTEQTGDVGRAGIVLGVFGIGNATGLMVQGHLTSRFSQRPVLGSAALMYGLCLLVLALTDLFTTAWAMALITVCLAGVVLPAVTVAARTLLGSVSDSEQTRLRNYSGLTASFLAGTTIGPALVSLVITVTSPAVSIIASAALAATSVCLLPAPTVAPARNDTTRSAVVRPTAGLTTLLGAAAATSFGAGALGVGVPALTISVGLPEAAGLLLAAAALGDVAGAVLYGRVRWRTDMRLRLIIAQVAALGVGALLINGTSPLLLLAGLLVAAGFFGAPVGVTTSALLDRVVQAHDVGRAFAAITSVGLLSSAIGSATAGMLLRTGPPTHAFVLSATALAVAALWTVSRTTSLQPTER